MPIRVVIKKMDKLFLTIITIAALYYLYIKLFKKNGCDGGCNCGKK